MGARTLLPLLVVGLVGGAAVAGPPPKGRRLPDFSLADPAGRVHTRASLARGGVVLVVTAPTLSNEDAQRGWDRHLRQARPRATRARLAFVEDLDQAWFPDLAVDAMRDDYVPGQDPVLLLDRRGGLRRALGVTTDVTVVLAFDGEGALQHAERGGPSAQAARRLWRALQPDEEDEAARVASRGPGR